MRHTVPPYFAQPIHPITITVIGCGGTGSILLSRLAQMNHALLQLGHQGLMVDVWDNDKVEAHNVGRQGFFPSDVGLKKAEVLVSRLNRAFGFNWRSFPVFFTCNQENVRNKLGNIIITCVDSVGFRKALADTLNVVYKKAQIEDHDGDFIGGRASIYWMDFGNGRNFGQVVLGTVLPVKQPKKAIEATATLPTIMEVHPDLAEHEDENEPSCSYAESLFKQDLMINTLMAAWGAKLLWDMFRKFRINTHGCYINADSYSVTPLRIK